MNIDELLSKLGTGSKKTVHLSVTPGVGLELIQLETGTRTVKNYVYKPLNYNESLRQISDMEAFKQAVNELFEEAQVSLKCNIVLNMPMVLFGTKELPLLLADDAVTEALTSEVEQSYVFKRYEPLVSWHDSATIKSGDMRRIFYSAIQKNMVEDIKNVLTELGATLISVQVSVISLIKALYFANLIPEETNNMAWNLMLVNNNGYSICSMFGNSIVEYYEEPLAVKSFEGDEIYNAINASVQITLMNYPASYMFVVSETDMVSAEIVAHRLPFEGTVNFCENNNFKKQDVIPVSLEVLEENAHKISLEAIGIASGIQLPSQFDFLQKTASEGSVEDPNQPVHIVLGSKEFDISPNQASKISFLISVLILIPAVIFALIVPMTVKNKQAQLDEVNSKLQKVQAEIKVLQGKQDENQFDVNAEIKKVLGDNRSKLIAFTALGDSVPKKLWLTYFVAQDDGKFNIKGESTNVEDIYTFYKNMKDSLINTQLRLHKLEMKTNSVDEAVTIDPNEPADYEFEITNMSEAALKPAAEQPAAKKDSKATPPNIAPTDANNTNDLKNKPLK